MTAGNEFNEDPSLRAAWTLDPAVTMLNHGSFGACARVVQQRQQQLRRQMEQEPVRFFVRQMQPLLDESRRTLAGLIGADESDVVFVRNATSGINSVLRSLRFRPGDELLVTDHDYNACRNVVRFVAERAEAKVVVARVPVPVESQQQVVDAVLGRVTDRTRLAVLDHITSPTAVVFPIERIVHSLSARGIDTLVDGAHAPGMVPLDMRRIQAAYYTANCHKWLCAPKGAGLLYVRQDRQHEIQPAVISHGYNTPRPGHTRLQDAFDWTGTDDPTPWLCVGEAIGFLETLADGRIETLMRRNHELALLGRRILGEALHLTPTCPEEMIGSMAALRLPDDTDPTGTLDTSTALTPTHRLNIELLDRYGIEVPVFHWPAPPQKLLRISAQAYNAPAQYERLAAALRELL
ncbi:MAG: aminotransferase class V-fold PLP-dependent enzyme [Thermoguttaceae bacterium]